MKSYPKISVVIPSYNKVGFIGKTLDSIMKQHYPDLEVIIQDGWSTDGTFEIIKRYAKNHPKVIRWESKKDKGQLDAINKGFKKSSGQILTFINADDVYDVEAFERVADAYAKNPDALWFAGRGKVINGKGKEIARIATWYKNVLLSLNSRFFLLTTNYLMQPSVFITRNAYEKYGPFTGTVDFVMEYNFWLDLSRKQMPVVIKNYLSKFRIEPATITKRMAGKLLYEDEKIVRRYTNNIFILGLHKLHNLGRILVGGLA